MATSLKLVLTKVKKHILVTYKLILQRRIFKEKTISLQYCSTVEKLSTVF
jgi:hypothetical protein